MKRQDEMRAKLYRFLARCFRHEPTEADLAQVRALRFPEGGDDWGEACRAWNAAAQAPETAEDLAVDYARVFLGAGLAEAAAAFPYESVYTSPKRIIMQDAWSRMHELLANRGLTVGEHESELLADHVSVELDYMARLCLQSGLREQYDFLNVHLANWLPEFAADVEKYAATAFYSAAARLAAAWVKADGAALKARSTRESAAPAPAEARQASESVRRGFVMGAEDFEAAFQKLREVYDVYGPAETQGRGLEADRSSVRFRKLERFGELVNDRQSDFSAKEVYYPVSQTVFRFDENAYTTVLPEQKKDILIFAHPCDINAIRRLDNIFLKNGGSRDLYYDHLRRRVRFALLECPENGFPGCWCVSMGSNAAEDYALAVRPGEGWIAGEVKDSALLPFFADAPEAVYEPRFVKANERKARLPRIAQVDRLQKVFDLPFWKEYNDKCISCGGCNTVCPTCACFETSDHMDQENSRSGERRRVWASCMIPEFTLTAGGGIDRPKPEQMMRFKALHKVFDYRERFGGQEHMCVGCGRCVLRCPEQIDFFDTIRKLYEGTEELIRQQEVRP